MNMTTSSSDKTGPTEYRPTIWRQCSVEGCWEPNASNGLCSKHYAASRYVPRPGKPGGQTKPRKPCSVEACDRNASALGLCAKHYAIARYKSVAIPGVYVIASEHMPGLIKIGKSSQVLHRAATIRTYLPGAELVMLFEGEDNAAFEAELHARFADRRVEGEWFRLSLAELEVELENELEPE